MPKLKAPRKVRVPGAGVTNPQQIPLGPMPKGDPKMAWHYLSREAKTKLAELRRQGLFGGQVGQAPYWSVQEGGNAEVGVEALSFIRAGLDDAASQIEASLNAWWGG